MTRAGRKQTLLKVQVATDVQSSTGATSRTWADVTAVYAEIMQSGGSETYAAAEVQNDQNVDVVIRWMPNLTAQRHRFVYTNIYESPPRAIAFDIEEIGDRKGRRHELVARCKVRYAEGFRDGEST
jgi:head-tail adaptor